jgi:hypothetical protein
MIVCHFDKLILISKILEDLSKYKKICQNVWNS